MNDQVKKIKEFEIDKKVGIWDATIIARIYADRAVVHYPVLRKNRDGSYSSPVHKKLILRGAYHRKLLKCDKARSALEVIEESAPIL